MESKTSGERDVLAAFLQGRDAACPGCGYSLRDAAGDRCPECGARLVLSLSGADPRTAWDVVAVIAVLLTTLYFGVRAAVQVLTLAGGVYRGTSMAGLRMDMGVIAVVDLAMTGLGVWWCVMIYRRRGERVRPVWARPTTAAAGLLLAVFVAFLLAYGVRSVG